MKGLTSVEIDLASVIRNKAVDVLQELDFVPAYSKYLLGTDIFDTTTYRPFSLMVDPSEVSECGKTEIDYLVRCASTKSVIPSSLLEGAIYFEGGGSMHCSETECAEEKYLIKGTSFLGNEINYQYQWINEEAFTSIQSDRQASAVFIKDVREVKVITSTFDSHQKSNRLENYLEDDPLLSDFME